ncbi:hypothetical protein PTRA_a1972 [Pseudoalteromonas translucida KMM 520]|uniref:Uncharacterized protein n=1 Tax=Pseudoalteromonas translucida KMM 520 TaxID=1315283 RepID=A0A0U2NH12_9GAMM|nr:hypothetical protein PTRA_a1972 [Pseudoalteromonas translucida KMM 520]
MIKQSWQSYTITGVYCNVGMKLFIKNGTGIKVNKMGQAHIILLI